MMSLKHSVLCGALLAGLAASTSIFTAPAIAAYDCRAAAAPGVNWEGCDRKLLMLRSSDLSGAKLADANLTSTDLRDSNLVEADFEKATLFRASLAGAKAAGTKFDRIEAYRADFTGIDAAGASFASAELQRASFEGALLAKADFTKADLGRAQFHGADLTGSRFSLANLARADFRGIVPSTSVDFDGAFLFIARLEGLDLSTATGLKQQQIDIACGDEKTLLPDGLMSPAAWPCKFDQE